MSHLCQFWFSKRYIKLDNRMIFGILSFPGARWYVVTTAPSPRGAFGLSAPN